MMAASSVTSMGSAMLFGTTIFCTVALALQSIRATGGDLRPLLRSLWNNSRSSALDIQSFTSIFLLLYNISIIGLIMLYARICEYHPPFPHGERSYDRDQFFFLVALLVVISLFTLKKNGSSSTGSKVPTTSYTTSRSLCSSSAWRLEQPMALANDANEILNRDQTDEWKGWMQLIFLLYHYYKAEEIYNSIRIMITCYVWMTGFGNFSFFYLTGDYSAVRVMQMLWRLNFLVVVLCLTQGTTYILYYVCLLHTYFFLIVYATMRLAKQVNYTKWGIRIKLIILAIGIFLTWDMNTGIFQAIHWPFLSSTHPTLGAISGSMWEWYFRSSRDHWSAFLGMLFALNFPIKSHFFRMLEAKPLFYHIAAKGMMGTVLFVLMYAWIAGPFRSDKFEYNQTNAYFGIIPVLAYIYFRNITPWLRSHSLDLMRQIGKTTLETYLMQHHIWLTSNAKTLLILIPGWPMMNFLAVTIIYVFISRLLHNVTMYLRGMILPDNRDACIRNLMGLSVFYGTFLAIAYVLQLFGMLNFVAVALCSISFGWILYQVVVGRTWDSFVGTTNCNSTISQTYSMYLAISPLAGAMVVVAIGIVWHHMTVKGAGPIRPLLATCENFVQKGKWVRALDCNDISRGASYREHHIASIGSCTTHFWGWDISPSSGQCQFSYRDPKSLQKVLENRNITFIGDSIVRHLYHASCRQLGDAPAGAYNTSMEKWTDFSRLYGSNVNMEFRWAPYVSNLTSVLDRIDLERPPDLVVIGGGAWDRLHTYNTVFEQNMLGHALSSLARELDRLKDHCPVVWVVPTTINSWALTSDQKKENIREDQMAEFRELYRRKGINDAVSFVLDGTLFTADRVEESYDGVHYPLSVYDAGAQILANAMDWLFVENKVEATFIERPLGTMSNPFLGLAMVIFAVIGICCFDGFMGLSYVTTFILPKVAPYRLYEEAFSALHLRTGLPTIPQSSVVIDKALRQQPVHHHVSDTEDESEQLLNKVLAS